MIDVIIDTLLDALKSLPIIFIAYLIVEYISKRTGNTFNRNLGGKKGPLFGSLLGALPQCGISAMASNFYSYRIITLGTLFAVYLSTSDEAFIIMLAHPDRILDLIIIFASKIVIAMIFGFLIDLVFKKQTRKNMNDYEIQFGCECGTNIMATALEKTLRILIYLVIASFLVNTGVYLIGEENIANFVSNNAYLQPLLAPLIGLIPSCAPSIILTELYLSGAISYAGIISGLLTGAGVGTLVLFRYNDSKKKSAFIILGLYLIGVVVGFIIQGIELLF